MRNDSVAMFDDGTLTGLAEPIQQDESTQATQNRHGAMRHQAIMSIDMDIWRDIIEAFNIREPMIPHREEEQAGGPGARGWYS